MEAILAIFIVFATTATAVAGLFLVRKNVSFNTLTEHHEVANPMVTIVATLYSVLLGFLVVCAFNKFDSCRMSVQAEANSIADAFNLTYGLPAAARATIQNDCVNYVSSVIDDEFPSMSKGKASDTTEAKISALWTDVIACSAPVNNQSTPVQEELLNCVRTTADRRHDRLFQLNVGLWPVLWAVLIMGNATIVVFTYFFAMKHIASQMIMVGLLSFMLSVNVYLVIDFSSPFDGACSVQPVPLRHQLERFRARMSAATTK